MGNEFIVILYAVSVFIGTCHGGPRPARPAGLCPPHDRTCSDTDLAIIHLDWAYDDHVCVELSRLNCNFAITPNLVDEQVCGTDGRTYNNHCEFAQARCVFIQHHGKHGHSTELSLLNLHNHGPCVSATLTTRPVVNTTSAHAPNTTTHAPASTPVVTTKTTVTLNPGTSDPITSTTTMAPTSGSTTQSVQDLMAQLYCQNAFQISCDGTLQIVCGSDGQFYPNKCEFTKAVCKNSSLRELQDISHCLSP